MSNAAWRRPFARADFSLLSKIIHAPSPIGMEAAMTEGVLAPFFSTLKGAEEWSVHRSRGSSSIVFEKPSVAATEKRAITVMLLGHSDKIRMQVRSIDSQGKLWIDSDSFLPSTLIGNSVTVYCDGARGTMRAIPGTVEALGAIHFADAATRSGTKGIKAEQLYVELGLWGEERKQQVQDAGIKPGDSVLLERPLTRCAALGGAASGTATEGDADVDRDMSETFTGAYLDNGVGSFVGAKLAEEIANDESSRANELRVLYGTSSAGARASPSRAHAPRSSPRPAPPSLSSTRLCFARRDRALRLTRACGVARSRWAHRGGRQS